MKKLPCRCNQILKNALRKKNARFSKNVTNAPQLLRRAAAEEDTAALPHAAGGVAPRGSAARAVATRRGRICHFLRRRDRGGAELLCAAGRGAHMPLP